MHPSDTFSGMVWYGPVYLVPWVQVLGGHGTSVGVVQPGSELDPLQQKDS